MIIGIGHRSTVTDEAEPSLTRYSFFNRDNKIDRNISLKIDPRDDTHRSYWFTIEDIEKLIEFLECVERDPENYDNRENILHTDDPYPLCLIREYQTLDECIYCGERANEELLVFGDKESADRYPFIHVNCITGFIDALYDALDDFGTQVVLEGL